MLTLPFFDEIETDQSVLIAGAGGGFDTFCGLPLYFALRHAGRQVHLANLSFSMLAGTGVRELAPGLFEVTTTARDHMGYFLELYLSAWFAHQGEHVPIYAFSRMGVQPLLAAYEAHLDYLHPRPDAVVVVDGCCAGYLGHLRMQGAERGSLGPFREGWGRVGLSRVRHVASTGRLIPSCATRRARRWTVSPPPLRVLRAAFRPRAIPRFCASSRSMSGLRRCMGASIAPGPAGGPSMTEILNVTVAALHERKSVPAALGWTSSEAGQLLA